MFVMPNVCYCAVLLVISLSLGIILVETSYFKNVGDSDNISSYFLA